MRRAYELGRLRSATLGVAFLLAIVTTALRFRGLAFGAGVWPGLFAGAAASVIPLLARSGGHCCLGDSCWAVCLFACVGGGLLGGGAIALLASRERAGRTAFSLSAVSVAVLAASLGCAVAGVAGVVGMVAGFLASAIVGLAAESARVRS